MTDQKPTVMNHYDNVTLARLMLSQCGVLFQAIIYAGETERPDTHKSSHIQEVAEIGHSIACEWSNEFDVMAEGIEPHLKGGSK